MKSRVNDNFPIRILGLYAVALVVLFLFFSGVAHFMRSHREGQKTSIPDEKVVAERLLAEKLTGPRYFKLGESTVETPHPYLSSFQARQQIEGVAKERGLDAEGVKKVEALIDQLTEPPPSRAIGTDRVNVWRLNLALDELP